MAKKKEGNDIICPVCGKQFYLPISKIREINYCSKKCRGNASKVQFCPKGHDTFITGRVKSGQCKICRYEYQKNNYEKNIIRIKTRHQKWRDTHKKDIKKYQEEHKKEKQVYNKQYLEENRERITKKNIEYRKERLKTDIYYRLAINLRARIKIAIRNKAKKGSAIRDLGCSIPFFKDYIEAKFYSNMTWKNYGKVWELDHILPLVSFNLNDREQFLNAVNYKNMQPLTIEDHKLKTIKDNLKWRSKHRVYRS
jgi:hypothetical protein